MVSLAKQLIPQQTKYVGVILQELADLEYSYSYKGTLKIMEPEQQATFGTTGNIFTDNPGITTTERLVAYHFIVQTNWHITNSVLFECFSTYLWNKNKNTHIMICFGKRPKKKKICFCNIALI